MKVKFSKRRSVGKKLLVQMLNKERQAAIAPMPCYKPVLMAYNGNSLAKAGILVRPHSLAEMLNSSTTLSI